MKYPKIEFEPAMGIGPKIKVTGYLVAPGLVVQRTIWENGHKKDWGITHLPSGWALGRYYPGYKIAIEVAGRLAQLGDWTQTKEVLMKDEKLYSQVKTILAQFREREYRKRYVGRDATSQV